MSYDYKLPPTPVRPVDQMRKYFYTVLFIKSFVYNVKGQAIIFRRKSLESLMKLLNDFDETYLHSSYEHSYQNKVLSQGNVDFLVKYTDNLDDVIGLIDQNAFVIKLSWQLNKIPSVYPQQIQPPPIYDCYSHSAHINNIEKIIECAVQRALNNANKTVKITKINDDGTIEVRQWDETTQKFTSLEYTIKADGSVWRVGEEATLINGKYLQKSSLISYKRVKVVDVSKISTEGKITIRQFNDSTKSFVGEPEELDLKSYCYGNKIPSWHVNDDALLFDNKYLQKLDVPEVYGFNGDGAEGTATIGKYGITWGDIDDEDCGCEENEMGCPLQVGNEEFNQNDGD